MCVQLAFDVAVCVVVYVVKPQKVVVEILICRIKLQIPLKWLPEFTIFIYVWNYMCVCVCIAVYVYVYVYFFIATHNCGMYVVDN